MNRAAFTVFLGSADFKYDSKIKQNYRGFTNVKLLSLFFFFFQDSAILWCFPQGKRTKNKTNL